MPYTHALDPVLLSIGPVEIRYYGLVYIIGFLLVWFYLNKYKERLSITKEDVADLLYYVMLGTLIGSRLVHVFIWHPGFYLANPLKIFAFWEGGMAFHGGLLGVAVAVWYFVKKKPVSYAKLADVIAIPAVFALGLGRIANFINGELWGTITTVPWCVNFPGVEGCRHPVVLYGAIGRFALFGLLTYLYTKKLKPGAVFWQFVFWIGVGRFLIDFLREDYRLLGLSMGQYLSLLMVATAIVVYFKYYRTSKTASPTA